MIRLGEAFALLWALLIALLSLMPGHAAPQSGFGDKIEHAAGYALLTILVAVGWQRPTYAVVTAILYGILIEIGQSLTPDRFPEIWDAFANGVGAIIGISIYMRFIRPKVIG